MKVHPTGDGRYRVAMTVATRRFEADGGGRETEVPLDVADVAVFGAASPNSVSRLPGAARHREAPLRCRDLDARVRGRSKATRVGIDPYNKIIDRNPDDNLKRVAD